MESQLIVLRQDNSDYEPPQEEVKGFLASIDGAGVPIRVQWLANRFSIINRILVRRTERGLRAVPVVTDNKNFLRAMHYDVGHRQARTTKNFVTDHFWRLTMQRDVWSYVRSCHSCQPAVPSIAARTARVQPIHGLLHTSSMDFVWPLPET